jgi:hypothetical protein
LPPGERLVDRPGEEENGMVWDVHIDDLIPSRTYRRVHYGEA